MKRTINVDMKIKCKKFETALNRFFKKYPEIDYWKEQLEYMFENNKDFDSDTMMSSGEYNTEWCWAVHLVVCEDSFYIAVIERD